MLADAFRSRRGTRRGRILLLALIFSLATALVISVAAVAALRPDPRDYLNSLVSIGPNSTVFNERTQRLESLSGPMDKTAVIIGDSQAAGARGVRSRETWPLIGLQLAGYRTEFRGKGGIGFVAHFKSTGPNYLDGIREGNYRLPYGNPALVVIEGGGNDARLGVSLQKIEDNAVALIRELRKSYPSSRLVMVGVLSKAQDDGGGRRFQVNQALRALAERHFIDFIDVGGWLSSYALKDYLIDSTHLNRMGHNLMGIRFQQALIEAKLDEQSRKAIAPPVR